MVNLRSEYGVTMILVIASNSSYEKHIYPFQFCNCWAVVSA